MSSAKTNKTNKTDTNKTNNSNKNNNSRISDNGSGTGKQSARERMAAERQRQALAARRRRAAIVSAAVAGVLAIAVTVGIVVGKHNASSSSSDDTAGRPLVAPPGSSGPNQTVLTDGRPDAPAVLTVYEDFRCPYCHKVETELGPTIRELVDAGRVRVEYHIASFLDDRLSGSGSRRAANAAACAQAAGKFRPFHDTLFANQPDDEEDDAFGDRSHLLDLAAKVDGLRSPAFDGCVNDATYAPWVKAVQADFNARKIGGTPTVLLNGRPLTVLTNRGTPIPPEQLRAAIQQAAPAAPTKS
ncbi:DsbA family protein [Yinghuangia seranimata]|uniref:DsbA family protein n=1 Tax=Yinghuangia seranimata TaxID=408067 RepID=UPI00248CDEFB|nr:thioredoxin domain-containing protein [Yinghuangia seranimata]MDI2127880.1 thioredoxin domain-containing protein [Yinghuangia seranimata]